MKMNSKLTLVQVLLLGALVVVESRVSTACTSSAQCASTQCCLKSSKSSSCAARIGVGGECYVSNDSLLSKFATSVFTNACPCKDGYICQRISTLSPKGVCVTKTGAYYAIPGK